MDESQDMNQLQYEIIRMLAAPENNLFLVGDDDQSIYRFRGARPEIMMQFEKDYPNSKRLLLNVNYRSTPQILQVAGKLIAHNKKRFAKEISTPNAGGRNVETLVCDNQARQAEILVERLLARKAAQNSLDGVAILSRTNGELALLAGRLIDHNLPFYMKDRLPNLYEHWIAKDLLAYLFLAASKGRMRRQDFIQVMNRPNRYISRNALYQNEITFSHLYEHYRDKDWMCQRIEEMEGHIGRLSRMNPFAGINYIRLGMGYQDYVRDYALSHNVNPEEYYEVLNQLQESARGFASLSDWLDHIEDYSRKIKKTKDQQKQEGVLLATLHSSKGLEFDQVYIINVNEGTIPYRRALLPDQIEEERRLFYVGITRAKRELTISSCDYHYDKRLQRSRFLEEITK